MVWLLSVDLRFLSRRTREMDTFTVFCAQFFPPQHRPRKLNAAFVPAPLFTWL